MHHSDVQQDSIHLNSLTGTRGLSQKQKIEATDQPWISLGVESFMIKTILNNIARNTVDLRVSKRETWVRRRKAKDSTPRGRFSDVALSKKFEIPTASKHLSDEESHQNEVV